MNSKTSLLLALILLSGFLAPVIAAPAESAFTYQGKLNDGATPASGSYDFRFVLYNAAVGGGQVGDIVTAENLTVVGGVFTASLDFGAEFDGSPRWIEVAVRPGAGLGNFTVLNPRQPLTAAPYALYALTPAGPQGVQGPAGAVGATGLKGDKGDAGTVGSTGLTGTQGAAGPTGASGQPGVKGNTGLTGPAGAGGPQGIQGVPGALGPVGLQGPVGLMGATGAAGATGPVGPTGAKGEKGVNWRGAWNGATAYAIDDGVAQNGASWLAKAVSSGSAPTVGNPSWDLLADKGAIGAAGPVGSSGLQGPAGAAGAAGPAGSTGPAGATGPQGSQGPAGSLDAWGRLGSTGTTAGVNFLGTTDAQALEFKVHGVRALRLEPTVEDAAKSEMVNVLAGSPANLVGAGVYGATIAGGGAQAYSGGWYPNRVTQDSGTVGGGLGNHSGGRAATVGGGFLNISTSDFATTGGGRENTSSGQHATVGGGLANTSSGPSATVGGGQHITSSAKSATVGGGQLNKSGFYGTVGGGLENESSGSYATVAGGADNIAGGYSATVPGGVDNLAAGLYSFAAGASAKANHDGSFVWAIRDNPAPSFAASRFHINAYNGLSVDYDVQRADGEGTQWIVIGATSFGQAISTSTGAWLSSVGEWHNNSDRNRKEDFAGVNAREILDKLAALPIQTWHYTNETAEIRHLGPMAQDFHAAFGLGPDDKSIGTVDADGVALAAIQGLNQKVEAQEAGLRAKDERIVGLERRLAALESLLSVETQH